MVNTKLKLCGLIASGAILLGGCSSKTQNEGYEYKTTLNHENYCFIDINKDGRFDAYARTSDNLANSCNYVGGYDPGFQYRRIMPDAKEMSKGEIDFMNDMILQILKFEAWRTNKEPLALEYIDCKTIDEENMSAGSFDSAAALGYWKESCAKYE